MIVSVTAEDLATTDPIARACQRALGFPVTVRGDRVYTYRHAPGFMAFLPLSAQARQSDHARGLRVAPFEFDVTNQMTTKDEHVGIR